MQKEVLLDDTIKIVNLNREGKFFESVTRADAESQMYDIKIQVDVNTDIYPIELNSVPLLSLLWIALFFLCGSHIELGWVRRQRLLHIRSQRPFVGRQI